MLTFPEAARSAAGEGEREEEGMERVMGRCRVYKWWRGREGNGERKAVRIRERKREERETTNKKKGVVVKWKKGEKRESEK